MSAVGVRGHANLDASAIHWQDLLVRFRQGCATLAIGRKLAKVCHQVAVTDNLTGLRQVGVWPPAKISPSRPYVPRSSLSRCASGSRTFPSRS